MARQRIQLEITGDSRSVERAFRNAGRAGSNFGRTMKTVGKVAAVGFGAAIVGVGLALRRGFGELAEAQKVAAQTGAVLKSTGGVANVTAKRVEKLATSLSHLSGVDDEAIASGANMLLTFTNIRNGARKTDKVFDMATQTVLDMSVALGKDIPTTAIMVGKALNDLEVNAKGTITGWSALRRVGVKVSSQMMAQAAAFIKAGKPMEAQKLLLQELNTEFGGSAKAFGSTMPGALGRLNNALDEVLAAFAQGFLPLILKVGNSLTKKLADPAFVARVRELGTLVGTKLFNAFKAISAWFEANWPGIKGAFDSTVAVARTFANVLGRIASVTPGGPTTLIGLIVSGVLLSKVIAIGKAFGTWGPGVGGGVGGKGKAGKAGRLAKVGKVAKFVPFVGTAVAAAGAIQHARSQQKMDRDRWNSLTAAQQRAKLRSKNVPEAALRAIGFNLKPLPPVKMKRSGGSVPSVSSPVLPFNPTARGQAGGGGDVYMDGKRVGSVVMKRNQRAAKNTAASRRGPFAGQRLALG